MKELFMQEREAEQMRSKHLDDAYQYNEWLKEQQKSTTTNTQQQHDNNNSNTGR